MAINDIFLLRVQCRSHARLWTINQHYRDLAGQDDVSSAQDLTDAWNATHTTNFKLWMAADTTVESLYSVKLTGGDAMPSLEVLDSLVGVVAGESLPPNNAVVVSLGSSDTGLIRPGRLYVAGIPKSAISAGNLTGVFLTAFNGVWQTIGGGTITGVGGDWKPVIYSTILAGVPRTPPIGFDVDSVRVKPILYGQRRRNSRQQGATP